ncbi:hypothetical protein [Paenibacillus kobensis]|uniref:hypothetical protein n=1 Tax=Paenibacillus kobensis TaxID=59841 RepID=UPI000FDB66DB|nr:hypothetical protein [Paenibacillus kobensis]
MSAIIARYFGLSKNKSNHAMYVISHVAGGVVVTILITLLTEPEHGIEMYFSNEMYDFYWIGAMSGLVFSLIEILIFKLKKRF